jgi:hypothetical protein
MSEYLSPTDTGAFDDWVRREPESAYGMSKECPVCRGYGGWNLALNAYPLHDYADTPENRHRYSHFRACCSHCNGWGYVHDSEMCSGHEWKFDRNLGRCYNRYRCIRCDKVSDVDSSD